MLLGIGAAMLIVLCVVIAIGGITISYLQSVTQGSTNSGQSVSQQAVAPSNLAGSNSTVTQFAPGSSQNSSVPPGVYVTALDLSPTSPRYHQEVTFKATFLNTTGTDWNVRWFVSIWLSVQPNRFGQTSWDRRFTIPSGTSSFETYSPGWKLTGPDLRYPSCVPFTAKVQWKEPPPDNSEPYFANTDGQVFQIPFEVCP
jgi:hypothetical protein